jgi:hypothetical protein
MTTVYLEGCRNLHSEELHNVFSSPDIIKMIKLGRMKWVGHIVRMGEMGNAYKILVRKPEGKRPLGRSRSIWEDVIKMHLRDTGGG